MSKIVVYETFYNPIEANIIKSKLLDSGVQCFLSDENTLTVNPLYNQALGGVRLHVFEHDVPLVRRILDEGGEPVAEDLENAEDAERISGITCPNCGSDNVGYVQATKERFGILTTLVSLLLMVYPFSAKKVHHCFNCQYEF